MKFVDEYRSKERVSSLARQIKSEMRGSWRIMEVCGGQTHSILKYGIQELLPKSLTLLHGPGCPVCVTPTEWIDKAIELSKTPGVLLTSFGDMLRVPGSQGSLLQAQTSGAQVRIVLSPLDAILAAQKNPSKEVVFFSVGFETTAPATAVLIEQARQLGIRNLSVLACHVLVPPALIALLDNPLNQIDGFLAAGHVCTVMGYEEYVPLSKTYQVPIVVTGFEPVDILEGILLCVRQLERGQYSVENQYLRSVQRSGNPIALQLLEKVFCKGARTWRGIGAIPQSGLIISNDYAFFDAEKRFGSVLGLDDNHNGCISGLILQGLKKPMDCDNFGKSCIPENPLGAPMVSSEGACSAYFRYWKGASNHV